jgi:hypothetical protein
MKVEEKRKKEGIGGFDGKVVKMGLVLFNTRQENKVDFIGTSKFHSKFTYTRKTGYLRRWWGELGGSRGVCCNTFYPRYYIIVVM